MNNLLKAARRWKIPLETALVVIERDTHCIYCKCDFDSSIRSKKASWEHIINDIRLNSPDNIALCCVGCNASKGSKILETWVVSDKAAARGVVWNKITVPVDL